MACTVYLWLPRWLRGKASAGQRKRCRFDSWVGKQEGMAPHYSILAWRIPRTEEPGGLQSMGSQRVGHNWAHTQRLSQETVIGLMSCLRPRHCKWSRQGLKSGCLVSKSYLLTTGQAYLCVEHTFEGRDLLRVNETHCWQITVVMTTLKGPCLAWLYQYICYLLGWKTKKVLENSQENESWRLFIS